MTESRRDPTARPAQTSSSGMAAVGAVILVGDVVLAWLWTSAAQAGFESTRPRIGWVLLTAAGSAAVGGVCVAVLGWLILRLRREDPSRQPPASLQRGATWVSGLAVLKLALLFVTMVVLGAFTELQGQLVLALGLLEATAVIWLAVSTGHAILRTAQRPD